MPYYHWFDFSASNDFKVRLADGREFDFRVGQKYPYLGNEIPANRLEIKSLTGEEIKVIIFLRPK